MSQPAEIHRELTPVGNFSVSFSQTDPEDPLGMVFCRSEVLPVSMTVYRKNQFYGLAWPTPMDDPDQIADVIRRATDKSGADDFTCIRYRPTHEGEAEVSEWRDGSTLDEVFMRDDLRLLRGDANDRSLLWERDWPVDGNITRFAWLADIAVNAEPIREVVTETIDPQFAPEVTVALDSLNAVFQQYRSPFVRP